MDGGWERAILGPARRSDDDPDSLFLEKVFLLETAVHLMDCLYRQFLDLRLDQVSWERTTDKMMQWMGEVLA